MTNYKKLTVWIFSMQTIKDIYKLTESFPSGEKFGLVSQMRRAAVSIASNIAEGMGRNHGKDTIQFLHMSRGSAYELETLLNVAVMTGISNESIFLKINEQVEQNIRLINGFINYLEKKVQT